MAEKIMIIEKIEDIYEDKGNVPNLVIGKQVFDATGDSVKVKSQRGRLEKRWDELQVGRAYSFTMGEFKGYPFVQDFKSVESQFVEQAQKQVEDKSIGERRRSMALSYSKDVAVAKIGAGKATSVNEIITVATMFESYMENGATVEKKKGETVKEDSPEEYPG